MGATPPREGTRPHGRDARATICCPRFLNAPWFFYHSWPLRFWPSSITIRTNNRVSKRKDVHELSPVARSSTVRTRCTVHPLWHLRSLCIAGFSAAAAHAGQPLARRRVDGLRRKPGSPVDRRERESPPQWRIRGRAGAWLGGHVRTCHFTIGHLRDPGV